MRKNNRILTYSHFSYIVWWKKGYQQFQEPRGTSVIKIKGIAKVSGNDTVRYIRMLKEIFYLKKDNFWSLRSGFRTFMGYSGISNSSNCMLNEIFFLNNDLLSPRKRMHFFLRHDKYSPIINKKGIVQV
jgi:hypothetical protein